MKTKQLFLLLIMSIMSVSASADNTVIDGIKYYLNNETLQAEVISYSHILQAMNFGADTRG